MYFKEVMFFYCAGINVVIWPLIFFSLLADRVQGQQDLAICFGSLFIHLLKADMQNTTSDVFSIVF